jgi:hypothetical protein
MKKFPLILLENNKHFPAMKHFFQFFLPVVLLSGQAGQIDPPAADAN